MKKILLIGAIVFSGFASAHNNYESQKNVNKNYILERVCYLFTSTCGQQFAFEAEDDMTYTEAWIIGQNLNVKLCGYQFEDLVFEP